MTLLRPEKTAAKDSGGRHNQKMRTRQALVEAALSLVRAGRQPTIAEVAEAAFVSTATAYRYFPNPKSLWADVMAHNEGLPGLPSMEKIFEGAPAEPVAQLEFVIGQLADRQFREEALWRGLLLAALERWFAQRAEPDQEPVPVRGDTRVRMAARALAPLENRLPPPIYAKLVQAVTLVFGADAMVILRDSCGLDLDEAKDVMQWSARALVRAALADAAGV